MNAISTLPWSEPGEITKSHLQRFMHLESLQSHQSPYKSYSAVARCALRDFGNAFGMSLTAQHLDRAIRCLLLPEIIPAAGRILKTLRNAGYTVIGVPGVDSRTFKKYFAKTLSRYFDELLLTGSAELLYSGLSTRHVRKLLTFSTSRHPRLVPSQILMVTTGLFRTIPSVHAAGIPSLLVRNNRAMESMLTIRSADPTYVVGDLKEVRRLLRNPPKDPVAFDPDYTLFDDPAVLIGPYYFCNECLHYDSDCTS